MESYKLKVSCATCKGTGIDPDTNSGCTDCNQTGYEMQGEVDGAEDIDWIKKKIKKIFKKLEIPDED